MMLLQHRAFPRLSPCFLFSKIVVCVCTVGVCECGVWAVGPRSTFIQLTLFELKCHNKFNCASEAPGVCHFVSAQIGYCHSYISPSSSWPVQKTFIIWLSNIVITFSFITSFLLFLEASLLRMKFPFLIWQLVESIARTSFRPLGHFRSTCLWYFNAANLCGQLFLVLTSISVTFYCQMVPVRLDRLNRTPEPLKCYPLFTTVFFVPIDVSLAFLFP